MLGVLRLVDLKIPKSNKIHKRADIMNEGEKLSTVLDVLGNYWDKFTSDLTEKEFNLLQQQLSTLQSNIQSAQNIEEINGASKNFFEMLSNFEHLKFLADVYNTKMRGGDLPELEEEIRIKIINYCIKFQEKIEGQSIE